MQFLATRVVFLLTYEGLETVRSLVEDYRIGDKIVSAIQSYPLATARSSRSEATTEQSETLGEHLKLFYNLALLYPRYLAIAATETREGSSPEPPERRGLGSGDSPSAMRRAKDLFKRSPRLGSDGFTSSKRRERQNSVTAAIPEHISPHAVPALVRLALSLPCEDNGIPTPRLMTTVHTLILMPFTRDWTPTTQPSFQPEPALPSTAVNTTPSPLPLLAARVLSWLDASTRIFCSLPLDPTASPDDDAVVDRRDGLDDDIDANLSSMLLLLRKMVVSEDDGAIAKGLRTRLLADDMCLDCSRLYLTHAGIVRSDRGSGQISPAASCG